MKSKDNKRKKIPRSVLIFLGIPVILILLIGIVTNFLPHETHKYSDIVNKFKNFEVIEYSMNLGSGEMEIKLNDGNVIRYTSPSVNLIYSDIKEYVEKYNQVHPENQMAYNLTKSAETSWFVNTFTFVILPMLIIGFMGWHLLRKITVISGDASKPFSFARAKPKEDDNHRRTTFASVAGADEEKEELAEIVDFLKTPEKYKKLGARIPKGVLLIGPPGTGKTLLARAIAGEADVPFFAMSGSDFVEMFVGVGASRVRDLFSRAKEKKRCIIFIDEIDAVARKRGAGHGGGHDEREQTLNQLLVEMDGFGTKETVIVIAATNRPDILDPAIRRPGRIDRDVFINYPDIKGREQILKIHAKGKPFDVDVKLREIAKLTTGFTGAELENVLNESALLAARLERNVISKSEIEESIIKVSMGSQKKSKVVSELEKKITAYHESGHAIVSYYCKTQDPVHEISIIPRGKAGGYTLSFPEKDSMYLSQNKMYETICVMLGGRVAEFLVFNEVSTGASNDIERATKTARSMVTKYGMSNTLGPVCYSESDGEVFWGQSMNHLKTYSEKTASEIDVEIKSMIKSCYEKSEEILRNNINKLHKVTKYLISNERINTEQFNSLMADSYIT